MKNRYQLRRAAGVCWLLDMDQDQLVYKRPLCLNETGGYFWSLIEEGCKKEQIVETICREFGLEEKQAQEDVDAFFRQLEENHIILD